MSAGNDSAFPRPLPDIELPPMEALQCIKAHMGLTNRELFALAAPQKDIDEMTGTHAVDAADYLGIDVSEYSSMRDYPRLIAKARRIWADALIAELAKGGAA